jgi:hypothetical protein
MGTALVADALHQLVAMRRRHPPSPQTLQHTGAGGTQSGPVAALVLAIGLLLLCAQCIGTGESVEVTVEHVVKGIHAFLLGDGENRFRLGVTLETAVFARNLAPCSMLLQFLQKQSRMPP